MKKILTIMLLFNAVLLFANDSIKVDNSKLKDFKVIQDTVNNKVNTKYYVIYNNDIYSTNKTTFDYWKVCKIFDIEPVLIEIKSKKKIVK